MSQNIVVVSGGFDPVHSGHIAMINDAAPVKAWVTG